MAKYSNKNVQTMIDIFKKGRLFQKYLPKQLSLTPNTKNIPYEPESSDMKITKYLSKSYNLKSYNLKLLSNYSLPKFEPEKIPDYSPFSSFSPCFCYHCSSKATFDIIDKEDLNGNILKKYKKNAYYGMNYMKAKTLKKKKKKEPLKPKTFIVFKAKGNINCLVSDKEYEDD